jgi:hypothetical protein
MFYFVGPITAVEKTMCWETDYRFFAEQQRLREKQAKQERRTELIDQLLKDAQQTGEEIPQAKENVPAK